MADFFSDAFDAITGQQSVPQQTIIPTDQLLQQGYGMLGSTVAPGLVAFNQALAPGLTNVQLGVTNQIDPSILANLRGGNKSILDQLNLGGALPEDLQNQVITNALEGAAASGFGVGVGGRGLVARDLGLTGLDLIRQRQQDAVAAGTNGMGISSRVYNPAQFTTLGAQLGQSAAADIQQVQAARDELANLTEDIRKQNFSSLLNTGGRIAGTVIGGIYGGAAGAQMGGQIGGSVITGSRVAGQKQQASGGGGGGGGMMGMLGGLMGGGGGAGGATGSAGTAGAGYIG